LFIVLEISFFGKPGTLAKSGYMTLVDTAGRESPVDTYKLYTHNSFALTTIFGPSGGPDVMLKYIDDKHDTKNVYDILKESFYINETITLDTFLIKKTIKQQKYSFKQL
jgi:hypothetical protein